MNSLPETALAFAREVMGLKETPAYDITDGIAFQFTDLNSVMEAAWAWCDGRDCVLETSYYKGSHVARVVHIQVKNRDDVIWERRRDCCSAVMSACLEAARKLNERVA